MCCFGRLFVRADDVLWTGDRSLFAGDETVRDPVLMALEYLEICKRLGGVTMLKTMQAHVRYIIEFQWCVLLDYQIYSGQHTYVYGYTYILA